MADSSLTADRIALRSLRFHWRIAASVALGAAVATAVITGALLVGDSMRGSLRELTEQRLGKIDFAVFPGGFFNPDDWLADQADVVGEPVVYFSRGVLETKVTVDVPGEPEPREVVRRAGAVQILATEPSFWDLDNSGVRPEQMPGPDSVVLNAAAADEIGVGVGDRVTVRLPYEQAVPADSPLGRNEAESEGLPRMEVVAVIPTRGLGRFALSPSQAEPLNVYLSRELVADVLAREGQANVLLIDAADADSNDLADAQRQADALQQSLQPRLGDYGLQLSHIQRSFNDSPVIDYYSLSSDRLMLADEVRQAVVEELNPTRVHPVMTYLANKIERVGNDADEDDADDADADEADADEAEPVVVPYSTLTAIDSLPDLPLNYDFPESISGASQDVGDAIPLVLNSWAAERLGAVVGDRLKVTYFEPETADGQEIARHFESILTDIVPITEPKQPYRRNRSAVFDQRPTVYNDPDLTPTVPGVTDQDSILNWDLPFPLEDGLVKPEDDEYWNDYRLTPKAFIPLAAGQRLFGSRFGDTTSLRIDPATGEDLPALTTAIEQRLLQHKDALGFEVQPIHAQQMAASSGTTPFDVLFLMLSMFVIFAALMLIALLLRLGLLARSREYGTLLATGWSGAAAARLATREGMLAAVAGALLGVALGIGYAWLVLWALRTWWVGAVTVPFLQFHGSVVSLLGGLLGGTLSAWATIRFTTRQLRRTPPRTLLAGQFGEADNGARPAGSSRGWLQPLAWVLIAISLLLGAVATQLGGQSQAGAFVGGGMLLLMGTLVWMYARLRHTARDRSGGTQATDSLWRLAIGNARRNPLRSTLTIGLMASACFLILSMSAFQLSPTDAGVGGFDLIGQTAQPYYRELSDPLVQREVFGNRTQHLAGSTLVSVRMRPGQDASCNNLYKAVQPTVLGVPERLAGLYESEQLTPFAWAASEDMPSGQSPWRALETPAAGTAEDPLPMVLDQATAMWALQIYGGVGATKAFEFDDGQTRHFKVVGLLSNSVLQGVVLIGEANFKTSFPQISGDQYFLIHVPPAQREPLVELLENRLGDVGMDITESRTVLARLLAVQNTYLRTFQSLGALGLLLGTIGLAIAQLRSVLERRGELAVMRAIGFTRWRLAQSVMMEHAALLLAGIGSGVFAALVAVVPYAWLGRAQLPLAEPLAWMAAVLVVGMLAGVTVLSRVIRMPLIQSLRSQ